MVTLILDQGCRSQQ